MTWKTIEPQVNSGAEFFEILNDFGNPLEILREAVSNSIDAEASYIKIAFEVKDVDGNKRLVITLEDDGNGMDETSLTRDFWGLGYSSSRTRKANGEGQLIGEKGHGTKIFLRSEKVVVKTQTNNVAFETICDRPLSKLSQHQLHEPQIRSIDAFKEGSGTTITVIGYNENERSKFTQDNVRDYLLWFTKIGSIELVFGHHKLRDFKVHLKCLDRGDFEPISFGHPFPPEKKDINNLFDQYSENAADYYVHHFKRPSERLTQHPEVTFDAIISVEGDQAKREYNPMISARSRKDTGKYRVADRYGIWLCKDYIPVVRINDWISSFGKGSSSFTLMHGFINCQSLKLTANRGTIANTDPQIIDELKSSIQSIVQEIDSFLREKGIYTLHTWQVEETTLKVEIAEYGRRVKNIKTRQYAIYKDRIFLEPQNEAEVFGIFVQIYALNPEIFDFQILDYNTQRGIDILARNNTKNKITESEYWYIEVKNFLKTTFNHAFIHLRWIVCWDFDKSISEGTEFFGVEESDTRKIVFDQDETGMPIYFLDNRKRANKIQIIRLREYLKIRLGIEFSHHPSQTAS